MVCIQFHNSSFLEFVTTSKMTRKYVHFPFRDMNVRCNICQFQNICILIYEYLFIYLLIYNTYHKLKDNIRVDRQCIG